MKQLVNCYKRMNTVQKASVVYIVAGFLQKGLSLLSGPIFTRILTQGEYGACTAYNAWVEIVGVVAMFSLAGGIYNNGMLDFKDDRDCFDFSMLTLSQAITIGVSGLYFFCMQKISFFQYESSMLILMLFYFLLQPAYSFWAARQRYEYKYILSGISMVVLSVGSVGLSMAMVIITKENRVVSKVWSEKILFLAAGFILCIYIAVKAGWKIKFSYWVYAVKFNLPLLPHYLSNYILNSMDRIMIINMLGAEEAAIYSISYSAAFMIQVFWQSVNAAIIPYTYENLKKDSKKGISELVIPFLGIYGAGCILVCFIAPEIFSILAPASYREGIYLFPPLVCGVFLTGLYCLFANIEFYYKSTKFIACNSIISGCFNIVLNYIFIKKFGYAAAAYTTLACYMIQTLLHYLNYRKILGKERIYNEKILLVIGSVVFGICFLVMFLYQVKWVRYCFIIVTMAAVVMKKNWIIESYKKLKG